MAAKDILQVAERVEKALAEAETIQKEVDSGLETTNQNIVDTTDVLDKVSTIILCLLFLSNLKWIRVMHFLRSSHICRDLIKFFVGYFLWAIYCFFYNNGLLV